MTERNYKYRGFGTRVFAGNEALGNLRAEVERLEAKKAFVICGQSISKEKKLLERVKNELGSRFIGIFEGLQTDSPAPVVEEAAQAVEKAGADLIIPVGGGTAAVSARAIAMRIGEQKSFHEMATKYPPNQLPFSPKLSAPKIPIIQVLTLPTTAMLRSGAAIKDMDELRRLELYDPKTRAISMIWDTEAVMTAAPGVFLNTCMGFLGGSIRNLAQPSPIAIAHADHVEVFHLAKKYVPKILSDPTDPEPRMQLMAAGYMINRSSEYDSTDQPRANFSILSGAGGSINTRYKCGQGPCGAVLGPASLRYSLPAAEADLATAARSVGIADISTTDAMAAEAAITEIENFYKKINQPSRLRDLGVPKEDIPRIAEDTMIHFFIRHDSRTSNHQAELERMLNEIW
ncbi:MAG: hypothetical protein CL792_01540 [Chloroflexi bacterium]|nr:hypothetical protein [Chloroflexota bacterium]|tara:strand:- start:7480 stop:8685 length:1206 start_codon:yes stop_codon:yes gene_type:complete